MVALALKLFVKNKDNTNDPAVRRAYGKVCGIFGIILNILLFAFKFTAGVLTGSVAVTADAFNNISDAGSSFVTMVGFALSGMKPDLRHPFGHGRFEYISGLAVSIPIIVMGFELLGSSIERIKTPVQIEFNKISVLILGCSIVIKLYMMLYNRIYGKKINSPTLVATGTDSLCDAVSTAAVLISLILSNYGIMIDGYTGICVSLFIIYSGCMSAKETAEPLLGSRPDKEFVEKIEKLVKSREPITGIHDFILHDYGPGRKFLTLHAEVPAESNILEVHEVIDDIENEIYEKYECEATIHVDPIDTKDERIVGLRREVEEILSQYADGFSVHDFRVVWGKSHTNVIFDMLIPPNTKINPDDIKNEISVKIYEKHPGYICVIKVDRSYV